MTSPANTATSSSSSEVKPAIGFIGGGNMAASLIGGLLQSGTAAADIIVAEPDAALRQELEQKFAIRTTSENNDVLLCESVILAVKPQIMRLVCEQLSTSEPNGQTLFISIAAGILSSSINQWLGDNQAIVRCMPNTPSLVQCGATAMLANAAVNDKQKQQAEKILGAVGLALWVESEDQINAVTAVSGSGPAYFFLMMEAMQAAGTKLGLSDDTARQLVLQTALGAARMANETFADGTPPLPPATLRERVTSKGGTTAAALASFEENNFKKIVEQALQSAHDRSISLSIELGK